MTRMRLILLSVVLVALMLCGALWTLADAPHHDALPIHWNAAGQANGFASPKVALLMMPGVAAVVSLVLALIRHLEPQQESLDKSAGLYAAAWAGVLIVLAAAHLMVMGAAWGWALTGPRLIVGAVGLLFVLLGNQLGKSRPMYMVGIRTPWTLANQDVWIATHRLGGKLMVAAGLLCLIVAGVGLSPKLTVHIMMAAIIGSALIPAVYSYFAWRKITKSSRQA